MHSWGPNFLNLVFAVRGIPLLIVIFSEGALKYMGNVTKVLQGLIEKIYLK